MPIGIAVIFLVGATGLSQFYRSVLGPISPEIVRDLGIETEAGLALGNTVFFAALLIAQIPSGIALDRFNPAKVTAAAASLAAIGAFLCMLAREADLFLAGRVLIGLGMAPAFMTAVLILAARLPPDRLGFEVAKVFALSNIGTLMASKPLVLATEIAGWRLVHALAAGVTVLFALLLWRAAARLTGGRGAHAGPPAADGAFGSAASVMLVFRIRGLICLLPLMAVTYATLIAILGVWAGAYFAEVHGAGLELRGTIQTILVVAQVTGIYAYGLLDRLTGRRRDLAAVGGGTAALLLFGMSFSGDSLWLSASILALFCFAGSYNAIMIAHARSFLPAAIAGRGMTLINLVPAIGSSLMPLLMGLILIVSRDGGGTPLNAYGILFAVTGVLILAAALAYRFAPSDPSRR